MMGPMSTLAPTRLLFNHLEEQEVEVYYKHAVEDINRTRDGLWEVKVRELESGRIQRHRAKFVFIGAGGGSLLLLQKTGIPEAKHIGGFPVSGLFMVCHNPDLVEKHHAKVYGKAKVGAPPRCPTWTRAILTIKNTLRFGPFAGFSPKFLKQGSYLDLFRSVKPHNLLTMLSAGIKELPLTKYLIQQVLLSDKSPLKELREFIPTAKGEDWEIIVAGQRVQVIKDTEAGRGTLQFGTEVVCAQDGSVVIAKAPLPARLPRFM